MALIVMMLTKALLPKKSPPPILKKMFEIAHIYSQALFDNLVNRPSSGVITYTNSLAMALIIV